MEIGEFHHTDGWHFKRLDDGSVRIRIASVSGLDTVHVVPPAEWASIVAHVAKGGEALAFSAAQATHGA